MIRVLRRIAGRLRSRLRDWSDRRAAAAALATMSDRDLADLALCRNDLGNIARGTYDDPREAIFAQRDEARRAAEVRAQADRRIAA